MNQRLNSLKNQCQRTVKKTHKVSMIIINRLTYYNKPCIKRRLQFYQGNLWGPYRAPQK